MADGARTPTAPGGSIGQFLLAGGVTVLVAHVLGMGAAIGNSMLLARLLQPKQLAAYFLTLSVVEAGVYLVTLGLPIPLTRFIAQARSRGRPDQARGALVSALPLWLGASVAVVLLYAGGIGTWLSERAFGSEIMASGVLVASLWLVSQGSGELLGGILRGFRRVGSAEWLVRTLSRVAMLTALLVWYATIGHAEFVPVLWLAVGTSLLGLLAALAVLRREVIGVPSAPVSRALLLGSALPLLLTGLVNLVTMRADLWTVGVLFEPDQVAIYGAAKRLIVLVSVPLAILNLVVPPIIAELYAKRDLDRLQAALRGAATLVGIPAIATVAFLALASEQVLGLAFGASFRVGGPILALLSLERVAFVWVGSTGLVLMMTGYERVLLFITLASAVFTVAAVVVGGHLYGVAGVAAGYVAGSSGQQLATWVAVRRTTGLRTDVDLANLGSALDALRRVLRARSG